MVDLSLVKPKYLWYVVGLIATDGNLSKDGRHIAIVSKDRQLLLDVRKALLLNNKIGKKSRGADLQNKIYSVLQIGDKAFYNFLIQIGLTSRKSLTIAALDVPDLYFIDFLRGVIDGDGNISSWIHRTNDNQQWSLRVVSGSEKFIMWLKNAAEKKFLVKGKMYGYRPKGRQNFLYHVKFGKFASKVILRECYYKNCLALNRKFKQAMKCLKSQDGLRKYGDVVQTSAEVEKLVYSPHLR